MCDTVVVIRPDGVWFAKNSDRDPNEAQRLDWQPAAEHPEGSTVRCTSVTIPQARRTHAVLLSRPYWMWGAEIGVNAHGLAIGNEAVFTRAPVAADGLTGMDLLRLALERCATVEEAVATIVALAAAHGQGGRCGHEDPGFRYHSSFLVADPRGAVVLETAGTEWATEPVTGVRAISNGLTIPGFAETRARWPHGAIAACSARRARVEGLAAGAAEVTDLFGVLRDHGEGCEAPRYRPHHGAMAAPCMHAGGLVAASQTTASFVAELRQDGAHRHWATATSAPCTAVFKPVAVDVPLDLGDPTDQADGHSLWWRHERLHRLVAAHPARLERLRDARDAAERALVASGATPADAFAEGDRLLERWLADQRAMTLPDTRPWYVRRYWRERDRRAGLTP